MTEATKLLGYSHRTSVHNHISRGRLAVTARSGKRSGLFWLKRDEVERFRAWRESKPAAPFVGLPDPNELVPSLRRLLPTGLADGVKDDAVSAMVLDILEGRVELSAFGDPNAQAMMIPNYVKEAYKMQGDPYGTVSLSKPIGEDGTTLADFIGKEDESLERLLEDELVGVQ